MFSGLLGFLGVLLDKEESEDEESEEDVVEEHLLIPSILETQAEREREKERGIECGE